MKWTTEAKEIIKKNVNKNQLAVYAELVDQGFKEFTLDAVCRQIRRMRASGEILGSKRDRAMSKLRVGYLDIEATHLKGNIGYMISWYIKPEGSNNFDYATIYKEEIQNYTFDRRLVIELLKAFSKYDILYTHYGKNKRYDIPFITTRAMWHGLEHMLPLHGEKFLKDTIDIAWKKFALHRNSLDSLAELLEITSVKKTPLTPRDWIHAGAGHPDSLEYVKEHNRHDVILLERIVKRLRILENPKTLESI